MASKLSNLTMDDIPSHTGKDSKKNNEKTKSYLSHAGAPIGVHIVSLEELAKKMGWHVTLALEVTITIANSTTHMAQGVTTVFMKHDGGQPLNQGPGDNIRQSHREDEEDGSLTRDLPTQGHPRKHSNAGQQGQPARVGTGVTSD